MERSGVRRVGDGVRPWMGNGVRPWKEYDVRPWKEYGVWPWMGDGVRGACVLCRVSGGRRSGWPACAVCCTIQAGPPHNSAVPRAWRACLCAVASDSVYARRAGQCPILSLARSLARSHTHSISRSLALSLSRTLELSLSLSRSLALSRLVSPFTPGPGGVAAVGPSGIRARNRRRGPDAREAPRRHSWPGPRIHGPGRRESPPPARRVFESAWDTKGPDDSDMGLSSANRISD